MFTGLDVSVYTLCMYMNIYIYIYVLVMRVVSFSDSNLKEVKKPAKQDVTLNSVISLADFSWAFCIENKPT